ncbi:MAG: ester cyclase [Gammaproteobacteria bacterium]
MNNMVAIKKDLLPKMQNIAAASADDVGKALAAAYHDNAEWRGAHPLNEMSGLAALTEKVWRPLLTAMPDLERRDVIFIGGETKGKTQVAALGHYLGTFKNDWLGIPASGGAVYLRYGEVHEIVNGKIARSSAIWDLLNLMRQVGIWMLPPSMGSEEMWPCPLSADGVVLTETTPEESQKSVATVLAMHQSLQDYDDTKDRSRQGLIDMPQKKYWHPKMMWYGPAGIGTSRGLEGFVDVHQLPFRQAMPNRLGLGHYVCFGDGKYSVTGGWPSVRADHKFGDWMGMPPTGQILNMRVMDFYLNDEGLIRENWIPLDIIDILRQMGTDVFARLRAMRKVRRI